MQFLFNRRVGTGKERGDIDIIAIAPSGVFVLDPKAYRGRRCAPIAQRDAFIVDGRVARTRRLDATPPRRRARAVAQRAAAERVRSSAAYCFMGADLPVGRLVVDGVPANDPAWSGQAAQATAAR